jgi:hypothetical protein
MNKGVLATLGFSNGLSAYTLETYSNLYEVPIILLSPPNKKHNKYSPKQLTYDTVENENLQFIPKKKFQRREEFDEEYEEEAVENVADKFTNEFQINMYPDITPLLISLLKYNRWKTVYYIYNYPEGE